MPSWIILVVMCAYFGILMLVSRLTARSATNADFFVGSRRSHWMLVAFGMIGSSLSGVTFISIPGGVGAAGFSYMQIVFGYLAGYLVVALVLLPLYYRLGLTSIYTYLNQRFGMTAHKTGAAFFLVSRSLGSAIRLMLVAHVLQFVLMDELGVPFAATCAMSILLIWLYTYRGGIKTIVFTDTLQTFFMLLSLGVTIWLIYAALDTDASLFSLVNDSPLSKVFHFEDVNSGGYFWKQFIGGMFITIGMTGLDQDMMQKNLSCRNIGDAKKNMLSFAVVLVFVNLLFLALGALLYIYAQQQGIGIPELNGKPRTDLLFPDIAMNGTLGGVVTILFLLGLIAAAYSSADSALTALTTSAAIDFFDIEKRPEKQQIRLRKQLHAAVSMLLFLIMIALDAFVEMSAINQVILFAGFTYGPLIGLFFFGILTKRIVNDIFASVICFTVTIGSIIWYTTPEGGKIGNYQIGPELIALNALVVFGLLWVGITVSNLTDRRHNP